MVAPHIYAQARSPYFLCVFFFKQKTAYEIKECDLNSDVCSSDLHFLRIGAKQRRLIDSGQTMFDSMMLQRSFRHSPSSPFDKSGRWLVISQETLWEADH